MPNSQKSLKSQTESSNFVVMAGRRISMPAQNSGILTTAPKRASPSSKR